MIIELNTKLLDIPGLNSNQLIFLSLVLDKNQKTYNQDVRKIVSLVSDEEISNLISQGLITSIERGKSITYHATDTLNNIVRQKRTISICFMKCTQYTFYDQMVPKTI